MPNITRRGLGTAGIIHDPNDYDLPSAAFSNGSNMFFDGNSAVRAPIFRTVYAPGVGAGFHPDFVTSRRSASGYDTLFAVGPDGVMTSWSSGSVAVVTPAGFVPATSTKQWTSAFLGDVTYLNRGSHVPYGFSSTSTLFAAMPAWDSTWRCESLRAYKDYLVALNVTKGAVAHPQMVKTSNNQLAGGFPDSWDATDATKNTTENELADLTSPLVDGAVLGDSFVIYSKTQVWLMTATTSSEVFDYRMIFSEGGLIAPNCVEEYGGQHLVFGTDDIYSHSGVESSKASLVNLKNRDFIFRTLDRTKTDRCFVRFSPSNRTMLFAYPTFDPSASFAAVVGCNRALVLNVETGTQTFVDLPDATAATVSNVNSYLTWATSGSSSWATIGGSYASQVAPYQTYLVFSCRDAAGSVTYPKLLAWDLMNAGTLSKDFDPDYNTHAYLERTGIDLDEEGASLSTVKIVREVFPQIDVPDGPLNGLPVYVQIGTSMSPRGPYVWGTPNAFLPMTDYKIDVLSGGRYLGFRLMSDNLANPSGTPVPATLVTDFSVNGLDFDIVDGGRR